MFRNSKKMVAEATCAKLLDSVYGKRANGGLALQQKEDITADWKA